jgi:prolyl 4-hydroxylase
LKRIGDYILVIDDVVRKEFCDTMIDKFNHVNLGDEKRVSQIEWDNDYRQFTELNVTNHPEFVEQNERLVALQCEVYNGYKKHTGADFLIPIEGVGFEGIRMKKYAANNYDQFGWHADVGDSRTCRRSLAFFTYLNDVEEGGETVFSSVLDDGQGLVIKPKAGRMVVFPPMWMFPHKGMQPKSGPKYIVSQYIHYV